jgi:hypothetical protein
VKIFLKVIKSSESNLILSLTEGKKLSILKIAQRGNTSLEKEYEILQKLKQSSKIYDERIPDVYVNKKIKNTLINNKFYFFQNYQRGLTLSKLIQKNKIKYNKAKSASKILTKSLVDTSNEDLKNCVNHKPSEIFRKLLMVEFQNLIKRPHLHFILSNIKLKIGNKYYNKLENSLDKIFSKKIFLDLDKQNNFLVDLGHFNFHGENIIIPNIKKINEFKLIDPDPRWKILDPMFSLARYFYTYSHDTAEKKKYYIKSNIFDLKSNNKNFYFDTKILWPEKINKVYREMFNINIINERSDRFEKFRFNISYLLCLLRGINANYEEKIFFLKDNCKILQNNGIFFSLLAIKFAHSLAYEK